LSSRAFRRQSPKGSSLDDIKNGDHPMSKVFFTGFPGFLGSELLPRVLARDPEFQALCLIQARFADLAQKRLTELERKHPGLSARVQLIEGDITQNNVGIQGVEQLTPNIVEIYHLAAVYDLSVSRKLAMAVNVEGTRRMLRFAEQCANLSRFQYVSTCYVSGRHAGIYTESDLDKGQVFNNFYEETKFLAEVEVQAWRDQGLPTTVYRPAIVVGDSLTGATQKLDGPYFIIRWLLRQPALAVLPIVGDPTAVRVNLVPRDFVVDAIAELSGMIESNGKVYQLADPEALTVDDLMTEIEMASGRAVLRLPLPVGATKLALDYLPGVYWLVQIPSAAIDYFVHPTHYTSDNTQADLAASGITVPPIHSYLERLVEFVESHPDADLGALV
jgi:thioester reductase-like protein